MFLNFMKYNAVWWDYLRPSILKLTQKSMMTSSNGNIFRVPGLLCGNTPVTGEFPAQRPVTQSFGVFFDLRWANNGDAGDLRRHRAHYDVIVMFNTRRLVYMYIYILLHSDTDAWVGCIISDCDKHIAYWSNNCKCGSKDWHQTK